MADNFAPRPGGGNPSLAFLRRHSCSYKAKPAPVLLQAYLCGPQVRRWVELQMASCVVAKAKGIWPVLGEGACIDDYAKVFISRP